MNTIFNWLIIALVSLLLEMTSPGLFLFLSFTFGACAGAAATWLGYSFTGQLLSALGITIVSFGLLTFVLRKLHYLDSSHGYRSNIYALQGKRGLVIKAIEPGLPGQVKIAGELWAARCQHNHAVSIGSWIEVIRVQGAHVIVEKIEQTSNHKELS